MLTAESLISFNETINWHIWLHWAVSLLILSLSNVFFLSSHWQRRREKLCCTGNYWSTIWAYLTAQLSRPVQIQKIKKKQQQQGKRTIFEIKNTYFQWADFGKYKRDQRSRKKKENPFTNCRVQVRTKLGFLFIWPSSEYLVLTSCNLIFDKQASIISACGLNNLVRLLIYSLIAPFRNKINRQIRKRFVKDDAG